MGIVPKGFEPNPGKKYIFNTWIKDDQPTDKSYVGIDLVINNSIHPALTCKAIVEGWKLIEGTIDLRAVSSGTNLSIAIKSTSDLNVLIDDIRMHPVDSHMKTYAYDDKTMRLMAEIDENGFATFYEYDSEGLLIRVKKETERGVMTLKESRSSYKKRLP
jgi:YD repeat-containing protein